MFTEKEPPRTNYPQLNQHKNSRIYITRVSGIFAANCLAHAHRGPRKKEEAGLIARGGTAGWVVGVAAAAVKSIFKKRAEKKQH